MTKHEVRSFSQSLISSALQPIPQEKRIDRNADPRPVDKRADKVVVLSVLAIVVGLLSLFTFAASTHAPESFAKDTSLMTMYSP